MSKKNKVKTDKLVSIVRFRQRQVGAVAARKEGNKVVLGWSKCMLKPSMEQRLKKIPPDIFHKEKAYEVALGRTFAKDAFTVEQAEQLHQTNAPKIPSVIRVALRKMASRAKRYFQDVYPRPYAVTFEVKSIKSNVKQLAKKMKKAAKNS